MAVAFDDGRGVAKDQVRARTLYSRACDADSPEACNNYGYMLRHGEGGTIDEAAGDKAYKKSCSLGDANACKAIGAAAPAPPK